MERMPFDEYKDIVLEEHWLDIVITYISGVFVRLFCITIEVIFSLVRLITFPFRFFYKLIKKIFSRKEKGDGQGI